MNFLTLIAYRGTGVLKKKVYYCMIPAINYPIVKKERLAAWGMGACRLTTDIRLSMS